MTTNKKCIISEIDLSDMWSPNNSKKHLKYIICKPKNYVPRFNHTKKSTSEIHKHSF